MSVLAVYVLSFLFISLFSFGVFILLLKIEPYVSSKKSAAGIITNVSFCKGHSEKQTYFIEAYPYDKIVYIPNLWIYTIKSNNKEYIFKSKNDLRFTKNSSITFDFLLGLFFRNVYIQKVY